MMQLKQRAPWHCQRMVPETVPLILATDNRHTILSIPRGPKLVLTASATALAASMLACRTSRFLDVSLQYQIVNTAPSCLHRRARLRRFAPECFIFCFWLCHDVSSRANRNQRPCWRRQAMYSVLRAMIAACTGPMWRFSHLCRSDVSPEYATSMDYNIFALCSGAPCLRSRTVLAVITRQYPL